MRAEQRRQFGVRHPGSRSFRGEPALIGGTPGCIRWSGQRRVCRRARPRWRPGCPPASSPRLGGGAAASSSAETSCSPKMFWSVGIRSSTSSSTGSGSGDAAQRFHQVLLQIRQRDGLIGDLAQCHHRVLVVVAVDGQLLATADVAGALRCQQDQFEAVGHLSTQSSTVTRAIRGSPGAIVGSKGRIRRTVLHCKAEAIPEAAVAAVWRRSPALRCSRAGVRSARCSTITTSRLTTASSQTASNP